MSEHETAALWEELKKLKDEFATYKLEVKEAEGRRLRAALVAAGGVILALMGFLWFEVIWPAIGQMKVPR